MIRGLFAPRYKRYAAWPTVLWCRLIRRHKDTGRFWSGGRARCAECGDYVEPALTREPQNISNDFLGMGLIIKEQRDKIKRLELENRLLFDHIRGNDADLETFNKALARAFAALEPKP